MAEFAACQPSASMAASHQPPGDYRATIYEATSQPPVQTGPPTGGAYYMYCFASPLPQLAPVSFAVEDVDYVTKCSNCQKLPVSAEVGTAACSACNSPLKIQSASLFVKTSHEHFDHTLILQTLGPLQFQRPEKPHAGKVYLSGYNLLCLAHSCRKCKLAITSRCLACEHCGEQRHAMFRRVYEPLAAGAMLPTTCSVYVASSRMTLQRVVPCAVWELPEQQCELLAKVAAPMLRVVNA